MDSLQGYCQCGCGQKTKLSDRNEKRRGYVKGEPRKFITGHNRTISILDERYYKILENSCWEFTGCINKANGYGSISYRSKQMTAHRAFYLFYKGQIPEKYVIDHLCHKANSNCPGGKLCQHRRCVNPNHLEAITVGENVHRGQKSIMDKDKIEVAKAMNKIFSYAKIAKIFGVSTGCIQHAIERDYWKV